MNRRQLSLGTMLIATVLLSGTLWAAGTPFTLEVPKVATGAVKIDGKLDESLWADTAGTLTFGPGGIAAGYDNEDFYNAGGQTQYNDQPTQIFKIRHDGHGKLYISQKANDKDIQSQVGATDGGWWLKCDSDGLGNFVILQKGTTDQYAGVTLTFFPTADVPTETVITSQPGTIHANDARGTTWDWSFLPGNNTVNKIDDVDMGYIIECVVDLTQYGYSATDTNIQVGIQTKDHDGTLGDVWPWNESYGQVFQWSTGNYAVDYGIDHLTLSDKMAGEGPGPVSDAKHWSLY